MALSADQIKKPVKKVRKLLKKMAVVPTPEQIHKLRTNSRRLEATLQALSCDSGHNGRRVLKSISKLRKRAGKVRDMDVLTGFASSIHRAPEEKECAIQLLEHLGAKRQRYARKFRAAKRHYGPELRKRLKRTLGDLEDAVSGKNARGPGTEAGASALKLISKLAAPVLLNKTSLHPYRLKVKELRNLLQIADNAKKQEFVDKLGKVKDAIGEWHDWQELGAIAKKVLEHETQCQLRRELQTITDNKYQEALALTEAMRKRYLRVSNRQNKTVSSHNRQESERGPANPVWSATASLAA